MHYGPNDTITGKILLAYSAHNSLVNRSAPTATLFGPLHIHVILHGRIRVKVRKGDSHRLPSDHSVDLFRHASSVHRGTLKAEAGNTFEYPFAINFPQPAIDIYGKKGSYAELMAKGDSRGLLPLSFGTIFIDHPDVVDISVCYRVGCQIGMPGIDVKTVGPEGDSRPIILYGLPRPTRALVTGHRATSQSTARVQNEYLLPEDQRPQGFKQKAKAIFTSSHFPEFATDVKIAYQQYIYPGQKLKFDIVLRHRDKSIGSEIPEVVLEKFECDFRAYTIVDVSERLIGPPQCIDRRTVQTLVCHTKMSQKIVKADDYSFSITTDPLKNNVCSFAHHKVSRQYLHRIQMQFTIANESVKTKCECPVILVPPPTDSVATEAAAPEEASLPSYMQPPPDDEQLPAYGEAGSSRLLQSA